MPAWSMSRYTDLNKDSVPENPSRSEASRESKENESARLHAVYVHALRGLFCAKYIWWDKVCQFRFTV